MSTNSGSSKIISLPQGGGAMKGLGEKFSPDLHTGTGNFTIPIALPPGRNGFQPQLNLTYSSGNGNGLFGLGWSLNIPGVCRKTSDGVPLYNENKRALEQGERRDIFILSGAEDLVRVNGGYPGEVEYRPRTEGLFAKITHFYDEQKNYWEVKSKDGLVSYYGSPLPRQETGIIRKPDGNSIFAWKLTRTLDPFGNRITYDYNERDNGDDEEHRWDQPLLTQIRYADYGDPNEEKYLVTVAFEYELRQDPFSDYRAGFELRTTKRCRAIKIVIKKEDGSEHKVREYVLTYKYNENNGISLLSQIDIIGFDDDAQAYDGNEEDETNPHKKQLPPLTFGYSLFAPAKRRFEVIKGTDLPSRALGDVNMDLVDLHGSGLPDILETNGTIRYWRNLGNGRFDIPQPMQDAPPHTLADPAVQMIDANGDGRMDMLVTSAPLAGYYSLTHNASWDRNSFQPYKRIPSFNLNDSEVRFVDIDGDGYTDILRSGSRFECFFNHPDSRLAWKRTDFAPRQALDTFPNVNFSDPGVKFADMTGDGLQDIVLVHDGNVEYWPNLGHNDWGRRISMRHGPRFPFGYDPKRILIGDVDGDGLADIVYVDNDKIMLWLNHSGNKWSREPIVIPGTPLVTNIDNLRLVDLHGTGVSGVLWSTDATSLNRNRLMFLDFTGGQKPYVLNEMNNHMGAITRVRYKPSTYYYLEDQKKPETQWRTTLPFPVQVVDRVEVIDEVSKGKLTTQYKYHHGYWDGAEREFRGFGMVEQFDTETMSDYHGNELHGDTEFNQFLNTVLEKYFSPPTLTKTWFHQGPVGEEYGDWQEVDYTHEYWSEDPQLVDHTGQVNTFLNNYNDRGVDKVPSPGNRRIKRDALRSLRGSILRTELYALDGSERQNHPYTVTEHAYSLREESYPEAEKEGNARIFFPHLVAQRTTQWERGDDPLTQFNFTDDYDRFGQPARQTTVAMPRRADKRRISTGAVIGPVQADEVKVLATHALSIYAESAAEYMHNRVAQIKAFELQEAPSAPDAPGDNMQTVLRKQWAQAQQVKELFKAGDPNTLKIYAHTLNYYDGNAFEGLGTGQLGKYGALVRTETLVFTEMMLEKAYADSNSTRLPDYLGGAAPWPADITDNLKTEIKTSTGYRKGTEAAEYKYGWYAATLRQQFDFQTGAANPRGLVIAMRDTLGHETRIEAYEYQLLPTRVKDAANLEIIVDYDFRVLQPKRMIDPNRTITHIQYNPIGLPEKQYITSIDEQDRVIGGTAEKPEITFSYNFQNFRQTGKPIYVRTNRRIHHASDNISDDAIEGREYSDGFGRLIQTRNQAEEWIFGKLGNDTGLPGNFDAPLARAVLHKNIDNFIVSGWQVFDNKGRVIEKYEPFFSQYWEFEPENEAKHGQHATMFYDPRGNVIRTQNSDGSQQRVILGRPKTLQNLELTEGDLASWDVPDNFEPTPWETYTYDANDLAQVSFHPTEKLSDGTARPLKARAQAEHRFTPASNIIDALGRVLCQVQRNGRNPANDWFVTRTQYDLRGNALITIDAHGRNAFQHSYDLLNRSLRVDSIDAGLCTSVLDAQGNLIEYRDSKGSLAIRIYDKLNRPKQLWARNDSGGSFTLRERIIYGDEGDHASAGVHKTLGKPVKHYDEAGLLEMPDYDFKGNLLEKSRRTIRDGLLSGWQAAWEKNDAENALETIAYQTSSRYDALNRLIELIYPKDVNGARKKLTPRYNRSGALEAIKLDDSDYYVQHIAYNAKGQRVLIAYGNNIMARYTYDEHTFRLARLRTEHFARSEDAAQGIQTWSGSGQPWQDCVYSYDLAGNITRIDERTPSCGIRNHPDGADRLLREFTYDPIYRLLSATGRACKNIGNLRGLDDDPRCGFHASGAANATQGNGPDLTENYKESFRYDPAGNMRELSYQAASNNWKRIFGLADLPNDRWQEAKNNRLTSLENGTASNHYQFDANGNLTRQNSEQHHSWDHADRMTGYRVQPRGSASASIEACYLYGSDGMRVKKWVRNQQGQINTTTYIDSAFEHHRQIDGTSTHDNNTLHVMDNQSRIALVRIGAPLDARDVSPQVQYHLGDHLGSSHITVGGDKVDADNFINREEYFPYGETSFGSFARKRYRYSGKERDEESGLYYFGARYFAPWMGRWLSADPIEGIDGENVFVYVNANPFNLIDPTGCAAMPDDLNVDQEIGPLSSTDNLYKTEKININYTQIPSISALNEIDRRVAEEMDRSLFYHETLRILLNPKTHEITASGPLLEELDNFAADTHRRVRREVELEELMDNLPLSYSFFNSMDEMGIVLIAGVVPRNENGQPLFRSFHDVQLTKNLVMASDDRQMRFALKDLREALKDNPTARKNFTRAQLDDIAAAKGGRMRLFVWHHSDRDVYVLHLVLRDIHEEKGNRHIGSTSTTNRDRKRGGIRQQRRGK